MLTGATPARGAGALKEGCNIVGLEFTTASEVVSMVSGKGQTGFSLGNFSTGVATLSFPKHLKFLAVSGYANTDSATPANVQKLVVSNVSYSAGTATVRCVDAVTEATEAIANGTYRLVLFVGE